MIYACAPYRARTVHVANLHAIEGREEARRDIGHEAEGDEKGERQAPQHPVLEPQSQLLVTAGGRGRCFGAGHREANEHHEPSPYDTEG